MGGTDGIGTNGLHPRQTSFPDFCGDSRPDSSSVMMQTNSENLEVFPVEVETGSRFKPGIADSESIHSIVCLPAARFYHGTRLIQMWRLQIPKLRRGHGN